MASYGLWETDGAVAVASVAHPAAHGHVLFELPRCDSVQEEELFRMPSWPGPEEPVWQTVHRTSKPLGDWCLMPAAARWSDESLGALSSAAEYLSIPRSSAFRSFSSSGPGHPRSLNTTLLASVVSIAELRQIWTDPTSQTTLGPLLSHWLKRGTSGVATGWWVHPRLQVVPFRTATLPPATHTNTFLWGDDDAWIWIEPAPAFADEMARFYELVRQRGSLPRMVICTHHHADHVGALSFAKAQGIAIACHPETAGLLGLSEYVPLTAGVHATPVGALRALHTPGHAPGHLVLEVEGIALAGDMVASVGTIVVLPGEGDMSEYFASLERLDSETFRAVLPAHGGWMSRSAAPFARTLQHRRMREERILAAVGLGATMDEIVTKAYADAPTAALALARLQAQMHLEKLAREGRIELFDGRFVLTT